MSIAATNIPISATTTDFVGAINAARAAAASFDRDLNTKLVNSFRALDREQKVFSQGLGRVQRQLEEQAASAARAAAAAQTAAAKRIADIGQGFKSVGAGLTSYVTLPLLTIGAAAFKTYSDIDALQKGLNQVTGSAAAGAAEFARLREVAKLPGIGLEEAVQGSVRLQAVGFTADNARRALVSFGNAIALTGGGKAELATITTQLGQMAAKGKVLAQDLKPVIEAAPAAAGVIKKLFGTVDSEEISAKLKAQGKDSAYFIELLTTELGKLEQVAGGPKNALENLVDSLKVSSFEFFKVADASLGLTDKLNTIGDFISGLSTKFSQLSPAAQTSILAFTGIAAAIGPISLAIGGIISILPALTTGFVALTGPIGLTVAAVVAGVTLIVSNWTTVKQVLTSSGIWDSLITLATGATDLLSALWQRLSASLIDAWNTVKGYVIPVALFIGETLGTIFRTAAGVLSGIFKVIAGVLTGNWSKFSEGMQNITVSLFNAITSLFTSGFKAILGLSAGLLDSIGLDGAAKSLTSYAASLTAITVKLKNTSTEAKKTSSALTLPEVTVKAKRTATAGAIDFTKSGEESALKKLKDHYKELQDQIGSLVAQHKKVPDSLAADFKRTAAELKKAKESTKSIGGLGGATGVVKEKAASQYGALAVDKRIEADLVRQIQALGDKAPLVLHERLRIVREDIEKLQALTSKDQRLEISGIKEITGTATNARVKAIVDNFQKMASIVPGLFDKTPVTQYLTEFQKLLPSADYFEAKINEIQKLISTLSLSGQVIPPKAFEDLNTFIAATKRAQDAVNEAREAADFRAEEDRKDKLPTDFSVGNKDLGFQVLDDSVTKLPGVIRKLKTDIASSLKETATAAFVGMGEVIGGLIAGTNGIGALPGIIFGALGGLLKQLGTVAIEAAIGLKAIKVALSSLNPAVALVAGIGLIAVGTAIQSGASKLGGNVKGYAKGGVFDKPQIGLFGEYAGASNNPEIATPQRLMAATFRKELAAYQGFANTSRSESRTIHVTVSGKLKGRDVHLQGQRYEQSLTDFGT
jgi:tape measure domain-containing protein